MDGVSQKVGGNVRHVKSSGPNRCVVYLVASLERLHVFSRATNPAQMCTISPGEKTLEGTTPRPKLTKKCSAPTTLYLISRRETSFLIGVADLPAIHVNYIDANAFLKKILFCIASTCIVWTLQLSKVMLGYYYVMYVIYAQSKG
jgi:hypothetical protein